MIAGNAVQTPGSPLDSARTLTSDIALVFAADYGRKRGHENGDTIRIKQ
jgi:ABC-type phosphate transport system permease subunit